MNGPPFKDDETNSGANLKCYCYGVLKHAKERERMRVVVSGGSGFIGSYLVSQLKQDGYDVAVLDKAAPKADKWIRADLLDKDSLVGAIEGADVVYHLGAIADATYARDNPLETVLVNVGGTANILEACRVNHIRRVIYASTVWVYNAAAEERVNEEAKIYPRTRHVYTTTKLFGEFLCHDYQDHFGLDFTILRFGIPYGPGGKFNVIPIFVKRALAGEPIVVRGDGKQRRAFVYVQDLARGCNAAMTDKARNQTYNLAGGEMVSLNDVISIIKKHVGPLRIQYTDEREGELGLRVVDSSKAAKELDWKPQVSLDDGIRLTIQWYRKELGLSPS